jgi:hypothetical protein
MEHSGQATNSFATGKTTALMKTQSIFLAAGWSVSIWNIGDGINSGYPYLKWQNPSGSPLPVELTFFTAAASARGVELQWKTATEVNNAGYVIEKANLSSNSLPIRWSKVGYIEGHGTTNAPHSYSFSDKPGSGKYQYRLKQIDRDGKFEYSKEVEVTIVTTPTVFALSQNYPNPFNPSTVIGYSIASASHVVLKVYDLLGREVAVLVNDQMQPGNYTATFDASRLSSGVYCYRLDAGSFSDVKRLSVMK